MNKLKRFVNDPNEVVDDMLAGYLKAKGALIERSNDNPHVLINKKRNPNRRVALISGGGSGHEPAFLGYLGQGYLDAVAVGEVFASPPASAFLDAALKANIDGEVIALIGNYAGDVMNMKMAAAKAKKQGVNITILTTKDDIASAGKDESEKRYGMAAGFFVWKYAGYLADQGFAAQEIAEKVKEVADQTRSIVVGLSSLEIPSAGKENFVVPEGKMEFGIGHHGEEALSTPDITDATEIGAMMVDEILKDFDLPSDSKFYAMISGLGATPLMESYIMTDAIDKAIEAKGYQVEKYFVGNFLTSLNMNGISLTLSLSNNELAESLSNENQPNEFVYFKEN